MEHRIRTLVLTSSLPAVVLPLLVGAVPAAAAQGGPSTAVTSSGVASAPEAARAEAFTAHVESIAHGPAIVTLAGTAPVGTSVELAVDGFDPVWVEAGPDGTWTGVLRLRAPHAYRIVATSAVSGDTVEIPVDIRILRFPEMLSTVDGLAGTISMEGTGEPGATMDIRVDDVHRADAEVGPDGAWAAELHGLAPGLRHVAVWQYFDGAHNGGVDDHFVIDARARVDEASASRQTGRIELAGRGRPGATLGLTGPDGPLLDRAGRLVATTVAEDGSWGMRASIPAAAPAILSLMVSTAVDGIDAGSTPVDVAVPAELTGTVEELADGSIRLSGTGTDGGVVELEAEDGTAVTGSDGRPVTTAIGRSWSLTVPRDLLPPDVVVARQRVDGVEQGALRLALPSAPVSPGPDAGAGVSAGGGSGAGVSAGGGTGATEHHATGNGSAQAPGSFVGHRALAYTGAAVVLPAVVAGLLLLGGTATAAFAARRRRTRS